MSLFDKLLVAHLVGDLLLQTEWQALNKKHNNRALISHIAIYSAVMLGVLVMDLGYQNLYIYLVVGMLAISHAILDRTHLVTRYMKTFRLVVERKPEPFLVIAVDQVFHILLLAVAAGVLSL
jgi:hypothetical protein